MKKLRLVIPFFVSLLMFETSQAQRRLRAPEPDYSKWTYDIGVSSGTYNTRSYTEVNLGLNWNFHENIIWRNAGFSRFGSQIDSAYGLDTSMRFQYEVPFSENTAAKLFAGPGYRISKTANSGVFGEGGAVLRLGSLSVGVGFKSIYYSNPGVDSRGLDNPRRDNNFFIIVSGGGAI